MNNKAFYIGLVILIVFFVFIAIFLYVRNTNAIDERIAEKRFLRDKVSEFSSIIEKEWIKERVRDDMDGRQKLKRWIREVEIYEYPIPDTTKEIRLFLVNTSGSWISIRGKHAILPINNHIRTLTSTNITSIFMQYLKANTTSLMSDTFSFINYVSPSGHEYTYYMEWIPGTEWIIGGSIHDKAAMRAMFE